MIVNRIYPSYFCGLPIVKGTYERQRTATLGGNESQERVCICFTNGPERKARARRAAINANVILWHDQMIFRCHERHRGTMSFVLPRRSENNDERIASYRIGNSSLTARSFFRGGEGEKKGGRGEKTTGADIDDPLSSPFRIRVDKKRIKSILSTFYILYMKLNIYSIIMK